MKRIFVAAFIVNLFLYFSCREIKDMNEIILDPGQNFRIHLDQSAGTGYQWTILDYDSEILEIELKTLDSKEVGLVVGGKQNVEVYLVAKVKGISNLVLQLKRAWETEPIEQKTYKIIVQ